MADGSKPSVGRPLRAARDIVLELRIAYHAAVAPKMLDLRTTHPFYTWWWCDRGGATIRVGQQRCLITPGQWVLLPPNRERHHRIEPGTVLVSISFEAAWATGAALLAMNEPIVADGGRDRLLRDAGRALCSAAAAPGAAGLAVCRMQGRLSLFVAALFERATQCGCVLTTAGSGDGRLDDVVREIRLRPTAGPLPWAEWSRRAGLSRSQLNRVCREIYGMSLRRKRDELLLDEVRQRLIVGSATIKQIAAALGFVDTAHLCRWTRQRTGRSPAELRRGSLA